MTNSKKQTIQGVNWTSTALTKDEGAEALRKEQREAKREQHEKRRTSRLNQMVQEKVSKMPHAPSTKSSSAISMIHSVKRGQIQHGYNLNDDMDRTLSWLLTVSESYQWQGVQWFPFEADIRETNVKSGAKELYDAIMSVQKVWDTLPTRYKTVTTKENGEKIKKQVEVSKPAWKGPLYYYLRIYFGNMKDDLEKFIYMDYEEGYSRGADPSNSWKRTMRQIKRIIEEYKKWLYDTYGPQEYKSEGQNGNGSNNYVDQHIGAWIDGTEELPFA